MILPQLEHSDLYRLWTQSPAMTTNFPTTIEGPTATINNVPGQPYPYAFSPSRFLTVPAARQLH